MAVKKLETDRATFTSDFIESDTERAVFLGDPLLDNMMSSLLALGSEVWATRRRMKVLEALLAARADRRPVVRATWLEDGREALFGPGEPGLPVGLDEAVDGVLRRDEATLVAICLPQ